MQYVSCPISTLCLGQAASMGSFLLAAGAPGGRISLPSAKIMCHQPSGQAMVCYTKKCLFFGFTSLSDRFTSKKRNYDNLLPSIYANLQKTKLKNYPL